MSQKKSLVVGRRTHKDILEGRNVRQHDDGYDMFEDYWTDSDGESSTCSKKSNYLSKTSGNDEEVTFNLGTNEDQSSSKQKASSNSLHHQNEGLDKTSMLNNLDADHISTESAITQHAVTRKELNEFSDVLSKTCDQTTQVPESPRTLRSSGGSALSKTFDKNDTLENLKAIEGSTSTASPLTKTSCTEKDVPENPKKYLRSTNNLLQDKTFCADKEKPVTPKQNLKNVNDDNPETPKRNLRNTTVLSPARLLYANKGAPETPKGNLRNTGYSPSKKFCAFTENTETPKQNFRNRVVSSPVNMLSANAGTPETPKRNLRNRAVSSPANMLSANTGTPETPKRNLRNMSYSPSRTFCANKDKENSEIPVRMLRSTNDSPSKALMNTEIPKRNLRSTNASPLSSTFVKKGDTPKALRSLSNTTKAFQDNDIQVLSKTKILVSDIHNADEVENVSELPKELENELEMPMASGKMSEISVNNINSDLNIVAKTNMNYDAPGLNTAELDDAVAAVLSKTCNKSKETSTVHKRNLRTANDYSIIQTDADNVLKSNDNPLPASKTRKVKKTSLLPKRISEIRKENSKRLSTAPKNKMSTGVQKILSHYDEYDAKILQMVRENVVHDKKKPDIPSFGNKMASVLKKKQRRSNISKKTLKPSKKVSKGTVSDEYIDISPGHPNKNISGSVHSDNALELHLEDIEDVEDAATPSSQSKRKLSKERASLISGGNVINSFEVVNEETNDNISGFKDANKGIDSRSNNSNNAESNQGSDKNNSKENNNHMSSQFNRSPVVNSRNSVEDFDGTGEENDISFAKSKKRTSAYEASVLSGVADDELMENTQKKKKSIASKKQSNDIEHVRTVSHSKRSIQNIKKSVNSKNKRKNASKFKNVKKHKSKPIESDESEADTSINRNVPDICYPDNHPSSAAVCVSEELSSSVASEKLLKHDKKQSKRNSAKSTRDFNETERACRQSNEQHSIVKSNNSKNMQDEETDNSDEEGSAGLNKNDKEMSPDLFEPNTSANSSKRSIEDIDEIISPPRTAKRRKSILNKRKTVQDEENVDEQVLNSPRKSLDDLSVTSKRKKKSSKSKNKCDNLDNVRRSNRQRFTPLERWRNERVIYKFEDGELKVMGIDKGTKDDHHIIQLYNRINYKPGMNNVKPRKPKTAKLLDPVRNSKISIDLHKKFHLIDWDEPVADKNSGFSYLIKRMIETQRNAFGFLEIPKGKEKPLQYMPGEDLQLTVMQGNLEVEIQKNAYKLEAKDMFIVPRGSAYSIKNIGNNKAFLVYVVGRFKFAETD